jgi:hypothetical protein
VTADPILALYDRNVLSWLDERPAELAVVLQALDEAIVRFIYTHILDNELHPPDPDEMARLTALRERLGGDYVPAAGWVWNVSSKFNEDKFFADEVADLYITFSESPSLTKRDESTTQGMPCSHSPLMVRGL